MNPAVEVTEDVEGNVILVVIPTGRRGRGSRIFKQCFHLPLTVEEAGKLIKDIKNSMKLLEART